MSSRSSARALLLLDHDKHVLCDSYVIEFVHDATGNYYDRGKYGCRNFHVIKMPLFNMQVLKLLLFNLPMLVTMFFMGLFAYKIPMHRKWVRLKCGLKLLLDAPFSSYFYSHESIIKNLMPS